MYGDLEGKMKEKLLEGLIEHMGDKMGEGLHSRMPHKGIAVEVAAPDKEHLKEGLEKAKELAGHGEPDGDEGSDEDRLMALAGHGGDDDEEAD